MNKFKVDGKRLAEVNPIPAPFSPQRRTLIFVFFKYDGNREKTGSVMYYGEDVGPQSFRLTESTGRLLPCVREMTVEEADTLFPVHPETGDYLFGKNVFRQKTKKEMLAEGLTASEIKSLLERKDEEYISKCLIPLHNVGTHPPLPTYEEMPEEVAEAA